MENILAKKWINRKTRCRVESLGGMQLMRSEDTNVDDRNALDRVQKYYYEGR